MQGLTKRGKVGRVEALLGVAWEVGLGGARGIKAGQGKAWRSRAE